MGVIYREFRTVETQGGTLFNVMFIGLNPERLSDITFNCEDDHEDDETRMDSNQRRGSYVSSEEGGTTECRRMVHSNVTPPTMDVGTNTENTTEITTRDYNNPINPSAEGKLFVYGPGESTGTTRQDLIDGIDDVGDIKTYREIVRENIDYDHLISSQRNDSDRKRVDEIFEIICDVVCSTKEFIRIGGEAKPLEAAKSVYLKLTSDHIEYVMECMDKARGEITNIRAYLITALYRSLQTAENYISQKVTHGQYEYALNNLDNGGELA
jgi:hypothetical protein